MFYAAAITELQLTAGGLAAAARMSLWLQRELGLCGQWLDTSG